MKQCFDNVVVKMLFEHLCLLLCQYCLLSDFLLTFCGTELDNSLVFANTFPLGGKAESAF